MTEQRIILNAPAKINLTLEVLKKRTDGYHDLRTVMHGIDVCDTVTVELSEANDGGIIVECTTPLPPVNTAFTSYMRSGSTLPTATASFLSSAVRSATSLAAGKSPTAITVNISALTVRKTVPALRCCSSLLTAETATSAVLITSSAAFLKNFIDLILG